MQKYLLVFSQKIPKKAGDRLPTGRANSILDYNIGNKVKKEPEIWKIKL